MTLQKQTGVKLVWEIKKTDLRSLVSKERKNRVEEFCLKILKGRRLGQLSSWMWRQHGIESYGEVNVEEGLVLICQKFCGE